MAAAIVSTASGVAIFIPSPVQNDGLARSIRGFRWKPDGARAVPTSAKPNKHLERALQIIALLADDSGRQLMYNWHAFSDGRGSGM